MYTQIKHVYLSYVYKYIYRQLSTEGMHDRDVMAAGYVDIIPSREKACMRQTKSRATRTRASPGEVLPVCSESGMMSRAAARRAAAVGLQPVVRRRQHRWRRRLPVPLPLVDEPVVNLLRVQPRRLCQRRLLQFLHKQTIFRRCKYLNTTLHTT
jgi:hypothetical protein